MPRLQIHRKGSIALSTLIDILGRVIEHLQHRRDTRRLAVGALDLSIASPNVVDAQTNTTRPLGDLRTLAQRIVDPFDAVILHVDEETRAELRMLRSRVEQGRRGVNEIPLRQGIVGLLDTRKVTAVKLNGDAHPHMLRSLPCAAVTTLQKVSPLQRLIPKVVKHEIPRIVNHRLKLQILRHAVIGLGRNALIKQHLCRINQTSRRVLVVVVNQNTGRQLTVIRMVTRLHHRTRLSGKLVQLRRLDLVLNLIADLLCDQIRVDMCKSLRKLLNASEDLVEGDRNAIAVALDYVHMVRHSRYCMYHPYL